MSCIFCYDPGILKLVAVRLPSYSLTMFLTLFQVTGHLITVRLYHFEDIIEHTVGSIFKLLLGHLYKLQGMCTLMACSERTRESTLPEFDGHIILPVRVPIIQIDHTSRWVEYSSTVIIATALVYMYSNCGAIAAAAGWVLIQLTHQAVTSWKAMILSLAHHENRKYYLPVLSHMEWNDVKPHDITFIEAHLECDFSGWIVGGMLHFSTILIGSYEFLLLPPPRYMILTYQEEQFLTLIISLGMSGRSYDPGIVSFHIYRMVVVLIITQLNANFHHHLMSSSSDYRCVVCLWFEDSCMYMWRKCWLPVEVLSYIGTVWGTLLRNQEAIKSSCHSMISGCTTFFPWQLHHDFKMKYMLSSLPHDISMMLATVACIAKKICGIKFNLYLPTHKLIELLDAKHPEFFSSPLFSLVAKKTTEEEHFEGAFDFIVFYVNVKEMYNGLADGVLPSEWWHLSGLFVCRIDWKDAMGFFLAHVRRADQSA